MAVATNTDSYSSRILAVILYNRWLTDHKVLMIMLEHFSSNFKVWSTSYNHTELMNNKNMKLPRKLPLLILVNDALLYLFFSGSWDRLVVVAVDVNLLLQSL